MILEGPGRQLRESQEHKDGGRESERGKARGWRLQTNFNEHQGEYQIFFPLVLSVDIQWHTALNHCHANKVFPIMPLVFGW